MMRHVSTFTRTEQLGFALLSVVAYDPVTQVEIIASRGRRRPGSPSRYLVTRRQDWQFPSFRVTAYTDDEAIEKASARLERAA